MTYGILLGDRTVAYELIRKKVKNINLRIYPDGKIKISAGSNVPIKTIEAFIRSRAAFIIGALDRYKSAEKNAPIEMSFEDNDSVRLFNESLTLKIKDGKRNRAERRAEELWIYVRDKADRTMKENTLDVFFRRELEVKIAELLPEIHRRFEEFDIDMPEIKIRRMKSRWGSCNTTKGIVTVNLALAEYPLECLEFVLAHELSHLVHPDHSKQFYSTLTAVMPDWKAQKKMLNGR